MSAADFFSKKHPTDQNLSGEVLIKGINKL